MSRSICGFPPRLFFYVASVTGLGLPVMALAVMRLAEDPRVSHQIWPIGLFFAFTLVADLRPVMLDAAGENQVSLAFVFIIAARLLFGWQVAVVLAATSVLLAELAARRPFLRGLFNSSTYALAVAATIGPSLAFGRIAGRDLARLTGYSFAGGALFVLVNISVVSGAIALARGIRYRDAFVPSMQQGGGAFTIMAFLAALTADLWRLEPVLLVLLAGPLFTVSLYQRMALRSQLAARDAQTDNLTGLGNHRAYQTVLRERIAEAEGTGVPFSLCLVDVDNFKQVNDAFGHPAGDEVLLRIGALLDAEEDAVSFRFGGDEFAVILSMDDAGAYRVLDELQRRLAATDLCLGRAVTISAGIASYPSHAADADELHRTADTALYWSKQHGKNRSCLYSPSIVRLYSPEELRRETERQARLRAAKNLVRFVDAKDASTADHSQIVSTLAQEIGEELGLHPDVVEQLRLAGLLHDLGKIGIPDAVLNAPRGLTPEERAIIRRHPEFGHSLLDGLGIEPVDDWILHHHEYWDGSGYPDGLAGEEIPLGSRIVLVADAFEAITADRPYRAAQSQAAAIAELRACARRQFDPAVVEALEAALARRRAVDLAEALA